jgi:hypothetical protein
MVMTRAIAAAIPCIVTRTYVVMLRSINQFFNQVFRKTRTVNNEPLNRVSLIVILMVDLFIIGNVFAGLDAISNWHLSPSEVAPCRSEWVAYRDDKKADRNYSAINRAWAAANNVYYPIPSNQPSVPMGRNSSDQPSWSSSSEPYTVTARYSDSQRDRLGTVNSICMESAAIQDALRTKEMQALQTRINADETQIAKLKEANQTIKSQYDSSLLEKIAGQNPANSINNVKAEQAKAKLAENDRQIAALNSKLKADRSEFIAQPVSQAYLARLNDNGKFDQLDQAYKSANFWYPTVRFGLQGLFLLPLMAIALGIHNLALSKGYGLVGLMTWHLLCIFFIPLIFKIFEFLQFGFLFQSIFDFVISIVGNLVFLLNYISILSIPVIGFGIIKLVQSVILNPKSQAIRRVQKNQCLNCAKTLQPGDTHCPHCGYHQQVECSSCHGMTYKHMPHCRHCGAEQGQAIG